MALLFVDGFDHYATADIAKKWTSVASSPTINPTGGRRGGGALEMNGLDEVARTGAASATFIIGFAFNSSVHPSSTRMLATFKDAGTVQCGLTLNTDGTLSVVRSTSTAVTGGTSVLALSTSTWHYIEWKVTIADSISANSCKVRVNGVDWITVAAGQDLKSTANATANQVSLWYFNSPNTGADSTVRSYDDFYLCDQSGSTNNDFLGDVRIDTLFPTSDGTYTAFTPSTGVSHFALVDETVPNTTDYNSGISIGARDSYGMADLPALVSQTVYGVQINAALLKDDAGAKSASTMVRSGSTDADGISVPLGTSQTYASQVYEQNPATTAPWTEAAVNAMEAGVKVVA